MRTTPLTAARNRLGNAVRRGDSPDDVAAARAALAQLNLADAITRHVASAPTLTAGQRDRLATLLHATPDQAERNREDWEAGRTFDVLTRPAA